MECITIRDELELVHNLKKSLSEQINELELLKSMYSGDDEVVLRDNNIINAVKSFIDGKSGYIPSFIDFTVNIIVNNLKVEICINLPSHYPDKEPEINVRCNQLNRKQESQLNQDLCNYIHEQYCNEVCLCSAIFWVQENINSYYVVVPEAEIPNIKINDKLSRFWIYSHHIYNKGKREMIVSTARRSGLTGFCLSGKPGIICIEGQEDCCSSWWKDIKSLNWQKIMLKNVENITETDIKFDSFVEISKTMSEFSKFMTDIGFSQIFNDLFGFIDK